MKRYVSFVMVGLTLGSSMSVASDYNPTPQVDEYVSPVVVKNQLNVLRFELGEQNVEQILGKSTLEALDSYAERGPNGVNANIAAAVTGGAAVAVVEYVWDRYVGNGPKRRTVDEQYFDLQPVVDPTYARGPDSATPAAVGLATAGAVAYKAVEYSMRKVFGNPNGMVQQYDETDFDLHRQY